MLIETKLTFKLAEQGDKLLIHQWLEQEHIKKWIHGVGLKNTLEGLERFLQGNSKDGHWIAYCENIPFGYLLTSPEGEDATTLDVFICDPNFIGKGFAVPMIKVFLKRHFSHLSTVYIDPEATNQRAIHVYQKAGFKLIGEFIASWHPVLHYKMQLDMKKLLLS